MRQKKVGSVVEWLKRRTRDRHGLGSKPTCAILLCPWERHYMALSPAWWSWQAGETSGNRLSREIKRTNANKVESRILRLNVLV